MILKVKWSDKSPEDHKLFLEFIQQMANRIVVGNWRYGKPQSRKKYMSRIKVELEAYEESGNREHLMNIANYCFLERVAPEHPQAHFNNMVESVTRHRFGGERREGD
jgi:hypothetical protein